MVLFTCASRAEVVACRGTGETSCVVSIALLTPFPRGRRMNDVRSRPGCRGAYRRGPPAGASAPCSRHAFENVTRESRIFWLMKRLPVFWPTTERPRS